MNNQNFVAAMLAKARDQMHRDRVQMPAHILTNGQRPLSDYVDDQYFIAQAKDGWLPEIKLPETNDAERIETAMLAAIEAAVNSQKVKLTREHLDRFMSARHPGLTFNCAADAWIGGVSPTGAWGMSETDAWYEAMSEVELWQDGTATRPAWLDCLIADDVTSMVAARLENASTRYLEEIVAHGIFNIDSSIEYDPDNSGEIASEFRRQAEALLAQDA